MAEGVKEVEEVEEEVKVAVEAKAGEEAKEAKAERAGKEGKEHAGKIHKKLALTGKTIIVGDRIAGLPITQPHKKSVETSYVTVLALEARAVGSHTLVTVWRAHKE